MSKSSSSAAYDPLLRGLAVIAAVTCFLLLFLGGLVTSNKAGLSVPDWPTSYYMNMYDFPMKDWIGGIFFEHTHRLFASLVGLIILVLTISYQFDLRSWWKKAIWGIVTLGAAYLVYQFASLVFEASASEPGYAIGLTTFLLALSITILAYTLLLLRKAARDGRPETENAATIRKLAWVALAGVITQGVLGGLTVKYYLPVSISTSHATLGQSVFCLTLALAVLSGRSWKRVSERLMNVEGFDLRKLSVVATAAVVLQLILGAVMRHTFSGLAIPTFPLAFGAVIPDFSSFGVAVNFTHRLGAVIVSIFVITTAFSIFKHYSSVPRLRRPAMLSLALLALQITLGGIVILYKMPVTPTTLHVSTGAGILGTMFYIAMQSNHVLARRSPSGAVTLREEPTPRIVVSEA